MALTPNLAKVRVTGSFVDSQGVADTGTVTFQLSTYLIDPVFNQVVTNQLITCQLVNGQIYDQGHVGVDLVATNDPDLYPGTGTLSSVVWTVTERLNNLPARSYPIRLDYTWQYFDLADLRDLAGNSGVGTGSQGNVGGVGDGGTTDPGGGTTNPGTGTTGPHASTHAIGGTDPLTPAMIGAATAAEVATLRQTVAGNTSDIVSLTSRVKNLESSTPTISTPPSPPRNVNATAGDGRVTVSFDPPTSDGGAAVTGYRVGLSNGVTASGVNSPIVVTGLTNGVSVYVSVIALNSAGSSDASDVFGPVTPVGATSIVPPGAPTNVSAAPGAGQATVSFTPPASNGGSSIVSYRVTASTGQSATGSSSPIVVTGLTNGSTVTFTVVAINSAGSSPASTPSAVVVPVAAPGAPTAIFAVAGDKQATVSFTAPASNGGAAVVDYTVTSSSGQSATGTSSPVVVTGLTNGVSVSFTVRARNSAGLSAASNPSGAVTPTPASTGTNVPSAPTNMTVTVAGASATATVNWAAPVSVGSSAVTGYVLTRVDANGVAATPVTVAPSVLSYVWSGLTVGQTYTLTVAAVNAVGDGPASTVVGTIPSASSGNGVELLTSQQSSIETTDLSGFTVNGTGITLSRDSLWSADGTYSLKVASTSGVANSSGVNFERIPITAGKSYQFTSTLRRSTDKTIGVVLKWRDSNNNALSNGDLALFNGASGTTSTITQTGTAPTGAVFLRVTVQYAVSSVNTSDSFNLDSSSVRELASGPGGGTVTTPSKPEQVVATVDAANASVTIQWAYNTSGTGTAVTGFRVGRDGTDSTGYGAFSTDIYFTTSQYTFTKLVAGQTYTFSVAGVNAAGTGPAYTVSVLMPSSTDVAGPTYPGSSTFPGNTTFPGGQGSTTPTPAVPGAPTNVSVTASATDRKPTVSWVAPTNSGGSAISGYVVNWTANDGTTGQAQTVAATASSYVYTTAFTASSVVTFSVTAVNSSGQSPAGSFTYTIPAATVNVPGQPATVTAASTGTGEVTVSWTPPASDGGSAVTGYLAGRNGTDATGYGPWTTPTPLASTTRSQAFTQLVQGSTYVFSVSAVNAQGTGSVKTVTFTVPAPAPTTTATATSGVNALTISWSLPTGATASTVVLNTGATSGTLGSSVSSYTFTGLTAGTTYTATVTVTVANGPAKAAVSGTPTSSSAGSGSTLGFKKYSPGAAVSFAANGGWNTWVGKKHGTYATWGGPSGSKVWTVSNAGKPWGILSPSSEYGSTSESLLGAYDIDVAPQFAPTSWANAATTSDMDSWMRARFQEVKTSWGSRAGSVYYRPYHEFNGDWFEWSVRSTTDQANFVKHWREHVYPIWREVMGTDQRFKLEWSPNRDSKYNLDVRNCFPGKDYVDLIGLDYYDFGFKAGGTNAQWTAEANSTQNGSPVGILAWINYANAQGVPIALPEFGIQFGDNIEFLQHMKDIFDQYGYSGAGSPVGKILYTCWHNLQGSSPDPSAGGDFWITNNGQNYSGRPKASPYWRSYLQNATNARWLP